MTQVGGFFWAADNSGARHLKCIQRPSGLFDVGDLLRMSVKKVARKRKYKLEKGSVVKAVVSELKLKQNRQNPGTHDFQKTRAPHPVGLRP